MTRYSIGSDLGACTRAKMFPARLVFATEQAMDVALRAAEALHRMMKREEWYDSEKQCARGQWA